VVTIRDIANAVGVSKMTVSRALNNKPRVSAETKAKVLKAAKELNYIPNRLARSLATQETEMLGVIVTNSANPYYAELIRGIEDTASANSYSVVLCSTDEDADKERTCLRLLKERRADGLILTPTQKSTKEILALKEENVTFVLMNRRFTEIKTDYVLSDNIEGSYLAVTHLIQVGHKRIAHIGGPEEISTAEERLIGYKNALRQNNIDFDAELFVRSELKPENMDSLVSKLLTLEQKPTAIFVYNDFLAIGVLAALKDRGLRMPDDIAVVGYDDIEVASILELTTVSQMRYELGKRAVQILLKRIRNREVSDASDEVHEVVLKPKLVIRASSLKRADRRKVFGMTSERVM
jgi:LacI family transcriptional regulator